MVLVDKRSLIVICAVVAACGLMPTTGYAEDAAFDELDSESLAGMELSELLNLTVVSASKMAQSIQDAPSIVNVITEEQIRIRGYQSVGEALRAIPGLAFVDNHQNLNVGVRGVFAESSAPSEIMKVMIDGQPIAFRPTSSNSLGPELIPIIVVSRIEVMRGPASALYGANAFLGVINVITKSTAELRDGDDHLLQIAPRLHMLQAGVAPSLNGAGSMLAMGTVGEVSYTLAATYSGTDRSGLTLPGLEDIIQESFHRQDSDAFDAPLGYPTPGYVAERRSDYLRDPVSENDFARVASVYSSLRYDTSLGLFTVDGSFQYFDKHGEFLDYSALTHKNRIAYSNQYVRVRHEIGQYDSGLTTSLAYAWGKPLSREAIYSSDDPSKSITREFGYQAIDVVLESHYAPTESLRFVAGVDFTWEEQDLIQLVYEDENTNNVVEGPDFGVQNFDNLGVYLQSMISPMEDLSLTFGARIDRNSEVACNANIWSCLGSRDDRLFQALEAGDSDTLVTGRGDSQLSYRAALVYSLPAWGAYMKAIAATSFKPPSPYQLYHKALSKSGSSTGDPKLKPQAGASYELLLGMRPTDNVHATLNYFVSDVTDSVVLFREQGSLRGRNADVLTTGVELSMDYQVTRSLRTFGNVSWLLSGDVQPKKKDEETDASWQTSSLNKTVPVGMYPTLMGNLGLELDLFEHGAGLFLAANYVGERRASLTNNQLYLNPIGETYTLGSYVYLDLTVTSRDFEILEGQPTNVSMRVTGPLGSYVDPGQGGLDIPGLGTQLYLTLSHSL